jgi:hypothetical protein
MTNEKTRKQITRTENKESNNLAITGTLHNAITASVCDTLAECMDHDLTRLH